MGRVWKFGDDINTDLIIPARFNQTTDSEALAKAAFCEHRPEFAEQVSSGDFIVAGSNFGCGSSREHAVIAIKAAGISAIIADSYARIFHRNAINIGLPVIESREVFESCNDGDSLEVDLEGGLITHLVDGREFKIKPLPPFLMKIISAGGLVNFLKNHEISELM